MAMEANLDLAGTAIGMPQPDIVLPSQHFGTPRKQAPEQRLMIAVLHDALDCVRSIASPGTLAADGSSSRRSSGFSPTMPNGRTPSKAFVGSSISTRTPCASVCAWAAKPPERRSHARRATHVAFFSTRALIRERAEAIEWQCRQIGLEFHVDLPTESFAIFEPPGPARRV